VISVLIVEDRSGALRSRAGRERVTRSQLATQAPNPRSPGLSGSQAIAQPETSEPPVHRRGVSRSRSRCWHAFAASTPPRALGIDVEGLGRGGQALRASPRFLGDGDDPVGGDPIRALRVFTRKEAILKADGVGFRRDPRQQPTAGLLSTDNWTVTSDGWWLYEQQVAGLLLCLACREPQQITITHRAPGTTPGAVPLKLSRHRYPC
jgi:hypothetical protein